MMHDYYELLGVDRDATPEQIKRAYRTLMKQGAHPDLGGDPEHAKQLNIAYQILLDPSRRAQYDRDLRRSEQLQQGVHFMEAAWRGSQGIGSFIRTAWQRHRRSRRVAFRVVRCPSCATPNRLPNTKSITQAQCGVCRSPLAGGAAARIKSARLLKLGLELRASGETRRGLAAFHQAMRECPSMKNPYLEIAGIYRDWGLEKQAHLYEELAKIKGSFSLEDRAKPDPERP